MAFQFGLRISRKGMHFYILWLLYMNYYVLQVTSTGESRAKCLLYKLFFAIKAAFLSGNTAVI